MTSSSIYWNIRYIIITLWPFLLLSQVYIWMRTQTTYVEERWSRMYGTFVHCSAFAEAANRPNINVLYANSLWSTESRQIAFGCSQNICRTAECCLPRLSNTSTLTAGFVFACRIPFIFRCKPCIRVANRAGAIFAFVAILVLSWHYIILAKLIIKFWYYFGPILY